jgi:phage terminase small subunit
MMVDAKDIIAPDGTMINLHNIPPEVRRAISSIDVEETFEGTGKDRVWTGYIKKVRFWDKTKAVEMLAKHKALLSDKLIVDDRRALHDEVTRAITENDATPK